MSASQFNEKNNRRRQNRLRVQKHRARIQSIKSERISPLHMLVTQLGLTSDEQNILEIYARVSKGNPLRGPEQPRGRDFEMPACPLMGLKTEDDNVLSTLKQERMQKRLQRIFSKHDVLLWVDLLVRHESYAAVQAFLEKPQGLKAALGEILSS